MSESGIYAITSPSGGQYIGSTISFQARWKKHRRELRLGIHHSSALQRAYDKYGADALVFSKLEMCARDQLLPREQFYLDSMKPKYNVCKVAGSALGIKWSEESKAKMRLIAQGRRMSEEAKAKLSAINRGKVMSPESRAKIAATLRLKKSTPEANAKRRAALLGRKRPPEVIEKMSAAKRGKKQSPEQVANRARAQMKKVKCEETGIIFPNGQAVVDWLAEQGHVSAICSAISKAATGARKSAYGYQWTYVND